MKPWLPGLAMLILAGCTSQPARTGTDGLASVSAPLALTPDGGTLWLVNPDADSVTALDIETLTAAAPISVGREPWSLAVAPDGQVVVMNRLDGSLSLLGEGRRTDIVVGPEPGGVALSPSGRLAYVTISSADQIAVVDLAAKAVVERLPVGRMPWAIAVSDDGDAEDGDEVLIVSHRLARLRPQGQEAEDDGKEAWLTLLSSDGEQREMVIAPYDFGYANVLEGLAVAGDELFVAHLLNSPELPRDFEHTVSAALSTLSLSTGTEQRARRIHLNDSAFSTPVNFPRALALSPDGATAYLALAGSDAVMGIDLAEPEQPRLLGFWPTGANPRGIVLDREGARAYVLNYLSRDVSVLELTDTIGRAELARVPVVEETLSPEMHRGKTLFNNASDPRLSHLGWISCASCHPDGGADGTTWLTPDGLRQTMPLWNLAGTEPLHASATRDEVQDFEADIESLMDGVGLAAGQVQRELGARNGGRSEDLDALAAFVRKGIRVPRAAPVEETVILEGRSVFEASGCAGCHGGPAWTVSHLPGPVGTLAPNGELEVLGALHDVGTYSAATDVLGRNGFDAPTLLGLHATVPYLHDGSAQTLQAVFANASHVKARLSTGEVAALAAFLASLDDNAPAVAP